MITAKSSSRQTRKQQRTAQKRKKRLQNVAFIVGDVIVIGVVPALVFSSTPNVTVGLGQFGKPIANFSLTDLNGGAVLHRSAGLHVLRLARHPQRRARRAGCERTATSIFVGRDGTVKTFHIGSLSVEMIEQQLTPLLFQ